MDLSNLRVKIRNKKAKRLGRGPGSGSGKTSGRGHKGAGQRAGKKLPYAGFRGGNLPLSRVIPKRGFKSPTRIEYQIINLSDIQRIKSNLSEIGPDNLKELKLIANAKKPVKVLAKVNGDFKKKLTLKVDKISSKAKELVEAAGGKVESLKR